MEMFGVFVFVGVCEYLLLNFLVIFYLKELRFMNNLFNKWLFLLFGMIFFSVV